MDRLDLGPAGATAVLVLLLGAIAYLGVLTLWSHLRGAKAVGERTRGLREDERRCLLWAWVRKVSLLYAVGWGVFAWGMVLVGLTQEGIAFLSATRWPVLAVWGTSPIVVYYLARAYWTFWGRAGFPESD